MPDLPAGRYPGWRRSSGARANPLRPAPRRRRCGPAVKPNSPRHAPVAFPVACLIAYGSHLSTCGRLAMPPLIEESQLTLIDAEVIVAQCKTEDDLIAACADADDLLFQYAPLTARVLDRLERCRVVVRYGTGMDTIDIPAAASPAPGDGRPSPPSGQWPPARPALRSCRSPTSRDAPSSRRSRTIPRPRLRLADTSSPPRTRHSSRVHHGG